MDMEMQVDFETENGAELIWIVINEDEMVMHVDEEVEDYYGSEGEVNGATTLKGECGQQYKAASVQKTTVLSPLYGVSHSLIAIVVTSLTLLPVVIP